MSGAGSSAQAAVRGSAMPDGYVGIDLSSVYVLADPDLEPLPNMTRALLDWTGRRWAEIDPATGEVMAEGEEG